MVNVLEKNKTSHFKPHKKTNGPNQTIVSDQFCIIHRIFVLRLSYLRISWDESFSNAELYKKFDNKIDLKAPASAVIDII
jgi:hypothetical protein